MFQVIDNSAKDIKYAGRSKAVVIDNRDPLKRGRIRVKHPLLGETVWIDYLGSPNEFAPPKIGDVVYIEADAGWYTHPVAHGRAIKGKDHDPDIPKEFQRDIPTNRGIYTPGGHLIEFDDGVANISHVPQDNNLTTKNRGIRITTTAKNKIHIMEDVENGNTFILIEDAGGNKIKLDYKNNSITINSIGTTNFNTTTNRTDTIGNNYTENTSNNKSENIGNNLEITVGNNITISCTNASISASGNVEVTAGGNAVVNASEIQLNGTSGQILTTVTDPVVDTIYGIPTQGVPTVKSG